MKHHIAASILVFGMFCPSAQAQFTMDWYTIDGGGGTSTGGSFSLSGTIGQADAGPEATGGSFSLTGGFWAGVGSGVVCVADTTTTNTNPGDPGYGVADGTVNGADLSYFVEQWLGGVASVADTTTTNTNPGDPGYGVADGTVNGADLSYFVEQWLAGCP